MGGSYVPRNLAALATDGRLVQIGLLEGEPLASVDLRRVLGRRLTLTGSTLRARSVVEKGRLAAALRREVWPLLESGRVRPLIAATFPLADAAAAHRLMESNTHIGKIVLVP
jgi:NADPH2:quinone reductase